MYYEIEGTKTRILGSIHLYPPQGSPPPERVEAAFSWAKELWVEHHAPDLVPHMKLPDGGDLKAIIPSTTWQVLEGLLPEGQDSAVLREFKLWGAFLVVARHALDAKDGVEPSLIQRYLESGNKLYVLEEAERFAALMDSVQLERFAPLVEFYGSHTDQIRTNFARLYEAWVQADAGEVWETLKLSPLASDPALYEAMFSARNRHWADVLSQVAPTNEEKTLVIVGAGHLVGPDNLVDLLRSRGLGVVPIKDFRA